MMYDGIKNFAGQFAYEPKVQNAAAFAPNPRAIAVGMGGSQLAAGIIRTIDPETDIISHRNYGLPALPPEKLKERLIILSSYSGNTEEVLDAFASARHKELRMIAIATGGKLLDLARAYGIPHIELPKTGIQPRLAIGFSVKAFLLALGYADALREIKRLSRSLIPLRYAPAGRVLAEQLNGCIPLIYASERNAAIAYNWKIKFNETAKIPAFWNTFPEVNHNEMTGFDVRPLTAPLARRFSCILLKDPNDHPRIRRRMEVLQVLYEKQNISVHAIPLDDKDQLKKIFSSLVLADWTAYYTAKHYGIESEQVPMVEEFKKLI